MEGLYILNDKFEAIMPLDVYESLIWTDRYWACGDFEICTTPNLSAPNSEMVTMNFVQSLDLLNNTYYLSNDNSEHTMIIESIKTITDSETGNKIILSGTSLEHLLFRRIVWNETILSGNLQNAIMQLLSDAIINPAIQSRKISNFIFAKTDDPRITSLGIEMKVERGDNLYDTIAKLCETYSIGFKIILNDNNDFVFYLYSGEDRSYDQIVNPHVTFSPSFDNIVSGDSLESKENYKNSVLVVGESKEISVFDKQDEPAGLARCESYVDARDISAEEAGSDAKYTEQLKKRGTEDLVEHKLVKSFDGEADTLSMYVYGRDFRMGDILQVENEYGMNAKSRVIEIITSDDESGFSVYPTFTTII